MRYRDYFSLNILNKYNVNPDKSIDISDNIKETVDGIVSTFGDVSKDEKTFLLRKTNNALVDMRILDENLKEMNNKIEQIDVLEAVDEFDDLTNIESDSLTMDDIDLKI